MEGELKKQASAAGEDLRKAQQEASKLHDHTHQLIADLAAANEKLTSCASTLADRDRCSVGGCSVHQTGKMLLMGPCSCNSLGLHQSKQRAT